MVGETRPARKVPRGACPSRHLASGPGASPERPAEFPRTRAPGRSRPRDGENLARPPRAAGGGGV